MSNESFFGSKQFTNLLFSLVQELIIVHGLTYGKIAWVIYKIHISVICRGRSNQFLGFTEIPKHQCYA